MRSVVAVNAELLMQTGAHISPGSFHPNWRDKSGTFEKQPMSFSAVCMEFHRGESDGHMATENTVSHKIGIAKKKKSIYSLSTFCHLQTHASSLDV